MSDFIGKLPPSALRVPKTARSEDDSIDYLKAYDSRLPVCKNILDALPGQGHLVWRLLRAYSLRCMALKQFVDGLPAGDMKHMLTLIHDGRFEFIPQTKP